MTTNRRGVRRAVDDQFGICFAFRGWPRLCISIHGRHCRMTFAAVTLVILMMPGYSGDGCFIIFLPGTRIDDDRRKEEDRSQLSYTNFDISTMATGLSLKRLP